MNVNAWARAKEPLDLMTMCLSYQKDTRFVELHVPVMARISASCLMTTILLAIHEQTREVRFAPEMTDLRFARHWAIGWWWISTLSN